MAGRRTSSKGSNASARAASASYTAREFVQLTGLPQRRLRSWTSAGVLPPPTGRGPATRYSDTHVRLAKAIQQLRTRGVPLRDVPLQLARMDRSELDALARPGSGRSPDAVQPPAEPTYPFTRWELVELMPGLILLVNPAKGPVLRRIADDIHRHYSADTQTSTR